MKSIIKRWRERNEHRLTLCNVVGRRMQEVRVPPSPRQSPLEVYGLKVSLWPEKTSGEFSNWTSQPLCDVELRHETLAANDCPIPLFRKSLPGSMTMLASVGKASKTAHHGSLRAVKITWSEIVCLHLGIDRFASCNLLCH